MTTTHTTEVSGTDGDIWNKSTQDHFSGREGGAKVKNREGGAKVKNHVDKVTFPGYTDKTAVPVGRHPADPAGNKTFWRI